MQFKIFAILSITAAFSAVNAYGVPSPETASGELTIDKRFVTPVCSFSGDLASFVIPPPAPPGSSAKDVAAQKKKITKAEGQQATRVIKQRAAEASVLAVLTAAATPLGLSGSFPVQITNDFHDSKADAESHATFQFAAHACGGTCVGHAYNPVATKSPGKGQRGKIFSANHNTIFGGNDI